MNRKEFRRRLLNYYVHPEMFLLPFSKNWWSEIKPFVFELTTDTGGVKINLSCDLDIRSPVSFSSNIMSYIVGYDNEPPFLLTNPKYQNTVYSVLYAYEIMDSGEERFVDIDDERYKNIFIDGSFPYSPTDPSGTKKIPKRFYNRKISKHFYIDWGDGTSYDSSAKSWFQGRYIEETAIETLSDEKQYKITTIKNGTSIGLQHEYEKAGTYKIKIYFKSGYPSVSTDTTSYQHIVNYKIVDWGEVELQRLYPLFLDSWINSNSGLDSKLISIPPITENTVRYIDNFQYILNMTMSCSYNNLDFFTFSMPYLESIWDSFYYNSSKTTDINNFIINIPDNSFTKAPALADVNSFIIINWQTNVTVNITIGNNFCRGSNNINYLSGLLDIRSSSDIKLSIGDNCFRDCKNLVRVRRGFLLLGSVNDIKIGHDFMRGCTSLVQICPSISGNVNIETLVIPEGSYRECPNIRDINEIGQHSYGCDLVLPDNFLIDLKTNTGATLDIFNLGYFRNGDIHSITLGKNMFSEDFLNECIICAPGTFTNFFNTSFNLPLSPSNLYARRNRTVKGCAPPLWNHLDTLSAVFSSWSNIRKGYKPPTIPQYIANSGYATSAIFGPCPSNRYPCQWANVNEIPNHEPMLVSNRMPPSYDQKVARCFFYDVHYTDFMYNGEPHQKRNIKIINYRPNDDGITYTSQTLSFYGYIITEPIGKLNTDDDVYLFDTPYLTYYDITHERIYTTVSDSEFMMLHMDGESVTYRATSQIDKNIAEEISLTTNGCFTSVSVSI